MSFGGEGVGVAYVGSGGWVWMRRENLVVGMAGV